MAINYTSIVPWGRNKAEYINMFGLTAADLQKKITSFGDGPASFNAEMHQSGNPVVSIDPVYQFSKQQIEERIKATKNEVIEQVKNNMELFVWKNFKNLDELVATRMLAMQNFVEDFDEGKKQGRYINHELPDKTGFKDQQFDIGLSSHFLLLYSNLGFDFHIDAITEMLRICKEIRIFPIIDLNAQQPKFLNKLIECFNKQYKVEIRKVDYEFQKGGNEQLVIKNT